MKIIPDLLLISGAALVSYGGWLVYQPAGFIVGGALILIQAVQMARAA